MEAIDLVANGLPVIEDAAQAVGAKLCDRAAGTLGDIGAFSFHGSKTMTTGEGGMVVTDRADIYEKIARLRDHGRTAGDFKYFVTNELAFKYRMSSLQAAFGRAQLARIDELVDKKRQIFEWYEHRLSDVPGLELNRRRVGLDNAFWMVTVVLDRSYNLSTRKLMTLFDLHMVDTRPFLPPLSSLGAFAEYEHSVKRARNNVVAYDLAARSINLPSALSLTESQVAKVCDLLQMFIAGKEA
jgi:perosamine synthetase